MHLLSRATLTLLNRRMAERGAPPLPMNRFRPNIVLVAQDVGERQGPEPLRTLATYRRAASGGVVFGTKFSVITPGKLSVGDEVAVKEWGDTEP